MSTLDFGSISLIILINSACEINPSSSGNRFGLGLLRKSSGLALVFSTEFEILLPILQKNLLNSFAILRSPVMVFPAEQILSIFSFPLLFRPVSSPSISHVFFWVFLTFFQPFVQMVFLTDPYKFVIKVSIIFVFIFAFLGRVTEALF
jgi:hypothetical protein